MDQSHAEVRSLSKEKIYVRPRQLEFLKQERAAATQPPPQQLYFIWTQNQAKLVSQCPRLCLSEDETIVRPLVRGLNLALLVFFFL